MNAIKPQLGYWKIRGLGAPIRMLLHYCQVPFEEIRYEMGDPPGLSPTHWTEQKHNLGLEFPNLPYLIDDRGRWVQTLVIMRYVALRYGVEVGEDLGHGDPYVDMMAHVAMDLRNAFVRCCYGSRNSDDVQREVKQAIAPQLAAWNKLLATGRPYCAGDRLSFADFFLAEHFDQIRLVLPGECTEHRALHAYTNRFFALERNQAFVESPLYIKWPVNNKSAFLGR
jgi:glutathione S-transferase